MRFWLLVRLLALAAFISFTSVGILFAVAPEVLTGSPPGPGGALWHSLALAFMATVSTLALMVALDPCRYLAMLLPLAVGKAVSSASSLMWLKLHSGPSILEANSVLDGSIALLSLAIYVLARRRGHCS